jgi:pimeloyl-ACP methyl ester carboxylesterase
MADTAAPAPTQAWAPSYRRVAVGRATLRVAVTGTGPPLLMLNGIGGNIEMWRPAAHRLAGRQLIMADMPGTGGSPALPTAVRMSGYARLVVDLLDTLGHDAVDVLGYSWGGALAQQLACQEPTRVRSLVLAATTPGLGGQPPAPWVIALMASPARYYSRSYLRLAGPFMFGNSPHKAADTSHADARLSRPPSLRGYAQQLYAISGWSSRWWLRKIGQPTLVLGGRHDPLAPARNARIIAGAIPGAQLRMVEGGHLFLLEDPEESCALIDGFLRDQADPV